MYDNDDYDAAIAQAQLRAKRFAEMRQQPELRGQMVGGRYIAPHGLEYVAQALRQHQGAQGEKAEFEKIKQLTQAKRQAVADALRGFSEKSQGTPENVAADGMGPTRPAQAQDIRGAYAQLMESGVPELYQAGLRGAIDEAQYARQQQMLQQQAALKAAQEQQRRRVTDLLIENEQGQLIPNQALIQAKQATQAASSQPYYSPVQTTEGIQAFNARTGKVEPLTNAAGTVFKSPQFSPQLQAELTGAKTTSKMTAEAETQKVLDAPKVIQKAQETITLLDDLLKAPGFKQAVGMSRLLPLHLIPGTEERDFDIRLEQLKGKQFLEAFESLKGGGAITELEGKKAQSAISRMDASSSEEEFKKAVSDFKKIVQAAQQRALAAQQTPTASSANPILPPDFQQNRQPPIPQLQKKRSFEENMKLYAPQK